MVGSNPHGPAEFLALPDQRGEFLSDAHKFFSVALVGVFEVFESLLVRVIARIDPNFLHVVGGDFCRVGGEVNVCHQRCVVTRRPQFSRNESQALRVALAWGSDAHQLAPCFNHPDALRHSARHIHSVSCGHGLNPDGVVSAQTKGADLNLTGDATLVIEGVGAVIFLCHR